ncbi:DUF3566 domain-containing protein [Gleimia hominis]|uniref:DUF3566 domain-containing protein n=1 Tax=Gleimia hominis TaxID=595468 RepID=A0ABU3I8V3_9ACTO|nr:DUF3566 domain-containing protein [Gleimia hominis]MDT3766793.1 DUF3566 domain-containing protein [Gleimia hominis]
MSQKNQPPVAEVENAAHTPRKIQLAVTRIDPWTVMKVSFLLSVAVAIAGVVATLIVWLMLDGMHVFSEIEKFLASLGAKSFMGMMNYLRLPQVMSMATLIGVVNIVVLTALSTVLSLVYNLVTALVGGIKITLMDE